MWKYLCLVLEIDGETNTEAKYMYSGCSRKSMGKVNCKAYLEPSLISPMEFFDWVSNFTIAHFYGGREVGHCLNLYMQEEGGGGIDGTKKKVNLGWKLTLVYMFYPQDLDMS